MRRAPVEGSTIDCHGDGHLKPNQGGNSKIAKRSDVIEQLVLRLGDELQCCPYAKAAKRGGANDSLPSAPSIAKPVQARNQDRKIKEQTCFNKAINFASCTNRDVRVGGHDERCHEKEPVRVSELWES